MSSNLWSHQKKAILRAVAAESFAFFFEMGTGKTLTTINVLAHKYMVEGRTLKTLILAPPVVLKNWGDEFKKADLGLYNKVLILSGTGTKRLADMREFSSSRPIVVTNYESLLMPKLFEYFKEWSPEVLVCDESHRLKNISAKRTKAAIQLADSSKYRYLLTGTPTPNCYMDIFSQFRILDKSVFGPNFFVFRKAYFYDKNAMMPKHVYFPDWRVRTDRLEDMSKKIASKSMTVVKKDCLDLPPLLKVKIDTPLTPSQFRMYEQMRKDFIAFSESGEDVSMAQIVLTKALRLQQIVSGFLPVEGKDKPMVFEDTPRQLALKELLADLAPKSKVIVWSVFKHNYETIRSVCESLKLTYVECHGEVAAKQKHENVDKFNNEDINVFIGHPGSGGIGINLVSSDASIFYSRSFSLENDLQAEARNYRGGSNIHAKVTRYDLVASNTIDEQILLALASKQDIGYKLLIEMVKGGMF